MSSLRVSDDDDVTIYMATANLPNPPITLEEKREHMTAAHRLIHAKYAAGVPFFTKATRKQQQSLPGGLPDLP
jgi:hypothetical protein